MNNILNKLEFKFVFYFENQDFSNFINDNKEDFLL